MARFLKIFFAYLAVFHLTLEIFLRFTGIVSDKKGKQIVNGIEVHVPYSKGTYVNGWFGEINSSYRNNNLGFNSILDYNLKDSLNFKIALIGDSFIEGYQTDVTYSIGRRLDSLNKNYTTYEFGLAELNMIDYAIIYEKYALKNFKYVFVFFDETDLEMSKSVLLRRKRIPEPSYIGKMVQNIYILKYFTSNNIIPMMQNALKRGFINSNNNHQELPKKSISEESLISMKVFKSNTIFIYKNSDKTLDPKYFERIKGNELNVIKGIKHSIKPYDFGKLDGHWNNNGRLNVAMAIDSLLNLK